MKKQSWLLLLVTICLLVSLVPMVVSAAATDGWVDNGNGTWSYYSEGQMVTDAVIEDRGVKFGFDANGIMYDGVEFCANGTWYRAQKGGALMTGWYYDAMQEAWFYYLDDCRAAQDFVNVYGTWYFFGYDGSMACDELVYSEVYGFYAISEDGAEYMEMKAGWNNAFGNWYYLYEDAGVLVAAFDEVKEINGLKYCFDWNGAMFEDSYFYCYQLNKWAVAQSGGALLENGWAAVGKEYFYAEDGTLFDGGVREIDGLLYYFNGHILYDIPGEYGSYYVDKGGILYRNAWRYDSTAYGDDGWVYYNEDGIQVYGLQVIAGIPYYFGGDNGTVQINTVIEFQDGVWVFGNGGVGSVVDGWFQHPADGCWMWAQDGDLVRDCFKEYGDYTYAFDYSGRMITEGWDTNEGEYYLFDAEGKKVTTPGWIKMGGAWYHVKDETGALTTGWVASNDKWCYLAPAMYNNTVFFNHEDERYYAADNDGFTTLLTGDGWIELEENRVYVERGIPAKDGWKYLDGGWYYFQPSGYACYGGVYEIDEAKYLFDQNGHLATAGWNYIYGDWYYAEVNGTVKTDMWTLDGVQYLFDSWGRLYTDGVYTYDNVRYLIAADGAIVGEVKDYWNYIGGKWYYLDGGILLRNGLFTIDGVRYGFSDGVMCTDGIYEINYDYYMFDEAGNILTGWQLIDGVWHYAKPNAYDPYMYTNGVYEINGCYYYFQDGNLLIGQFYSNNFDAYITTDDNGAIIDATELEEGWNYANGAFIFMQGYRPFTGWVGDYYVDYGVMQHNCVVEYAGAYYYLNTEGTYVRGGWYADYEGDYVFAREDGTLVSSAWLDWNGVWYYFNGPWMVKDTTIYVDGAEHEFNEDGAWIGERKADESVMPDGFNKINGKTYYYHANARQYGMLYIDGAWYCFDRSEDGAMVANDLYDGYYFAKDGKRANLIGWHTVLGRWMYFAPDHTVQTGMIKAYNGWYYVAYRYDEKADKSYPTMLANEAIVNSGRLYHFDANGLSAGPVVCNGWYQVGADWYYLENNYVVDGARTINGVDYFFRSGKMLTNAIAYVANGTGYSAKFFGADGVAVDAQGWIYWTRELTNGETESKWIYVGADGFLYESGIYFINGTRYTFVNYGMV